MHASVPGEESSYLKSLGIRVRRGELPPLRPVVTYVGWNVDIVWIPRVDIYHVKTNAGAIDNL